MPRKTRREFITKYELREQAEQERALRRLRRELRAAARRRRASSWSQK